jgi:hypothetical protein
LTVQRNRFTPGALEAKYLAANEVTSKGRPADVQFQLSERIESQNSDCGGASLGFIATKQFVKIAGNLRQDDA